MNTDTRKLLYPSRILLFFRTTTVYTEKNISYYQVAVVTLFWAQKRKLDTKYSTGVCEMKTLTCSLLPPLNQNRLCQDIDVYTQTFILDFKFLLNLPLLWQRTLGGR